MYHHRLSSETAAVHEEAGGYGVGENVSRTGDVVVGGDDGEVREAQARGDGDEAVKVKTIVRETQKSVEMTRARVVVAQSKKCHGAEVA
jgi:hypothetical protein